jgi:hypothetical protein
VFIAEYMAAEAAGEKIHYGLRVVESWNRADADLFYGSAATPGRESGDRGGKPGCCAVCGRIP